MATDVNPVLPQILKVILTEDWYACTKTTALLYFNPEQDGDLAQSPNYQEEIPLDDPDGMITWDMGADESLGPPFFIPAGRILLVSRPQDAFDGHYELIHVGQKCEEANEGGIVLPTPPSIWTNAWQTTPRIIGSYGGGNYGSVIQWDEFEVGGAGGEPTLIGAYPNGVITINTPGDYLVSCGVTVTDDPDQTPGYAFGPNTFFATVWHGLSGNPGPSGNPGFAQSTWFGATAAGFLFTLSAATGQGCHSSVFTCGEGDVIGAFVFSLNVSCLIIQTWLTACLLPPRAVSGNTNL